jgi:rhamnosyltransferase
VTSSDETIRREATKQGPRICAVIVTYQFNAERLEELIDAIAAQVDFLYIIDNNGHTDADYSTLRVAQDDGSSIKKRWIRNKENIGLSKALNQGLRLALTDGYEYILLLDQDSLPTAGMMSNLLRALEELSLHYPKIAAIGPSIMDENRNGFLPFIRFGKAQIKKIVPAREPAVPIQTDFLISSGCLLNAKAVKIIGMMDSFLFIDNIDLEWCFRARRHGYLLFGIPDAVLYHRIGDRIIRFPISKKPILIHSPLRQYYMMRNRIILYGRRYVPFCWKVHDLLRLIFKFFFFSLFVAPKSANTRMMLRGLRDGIRRVC